MIELKLLTAYWSVNASTETNMSKAVMILLVRQNGNFYFFRCNLCKTKRLSNSQMIMACSIVFAEEGFDNGMSHSGHLQPTSRTVRTCQINPEEFIIRGQRDLINTLITPASHLCFVDETGKVLLSPRSPEDRLFQSCEQGPPSLTVLVNNNAFTQLTRLTYFCLISTTGTISFMKNWLIPHCKMGIIYTLEFKPISFCFRLNSFLY